MNKTNGGSRAYTPERLTRAARIYASNRDAALALGIDPKSFIRACKRAGIETPKQRKNREKNP